jgi:hypothetical protein
MQVTRKKEAIMKFNDEQEKELWMRVAANRAVIFYPNGSWFKPSEIAAYADAAVIEFRKRDPFAV